LKNLTLAFTHSQIYVTVHNALQSSVNNHEERRKPPECALKTSGVMKNSADVTLLYLLQDRFESAAGH